MLVTNYEVNDIRS